MHTTQFLPVSGLRGVNAHARTIHVLHKLFDCRTPFAAVFSCKRDSTTFLFLVLDVVVTKRRRVSSSMKKGSPAAILPLP